MIPARFNGPPGARTAATPAGAWRPLVGAESPQVSLRTPPPLERPLVRDQTTASAWSSTTAATLVAEGEPTELLLDVPDAVPGAAEAAAARGRPRDLGRGAPLPHLRGLRPRPRSRATGCASSPGALAGRDGLFARRLDPRRVARGRRTGTCARSACGRALDCPTSAPGRELRRGPADGARPAHRPARLRGPRGRARTRWSRGRSRSTGASATRPARCSTQTGGMLCASRALWIELREPRGVSLGARGRPHHRTCPVLRGHLRSRGDDCEGDRVVSVRGDARRRLQPRLHLPEGARARRSCTRTPTGSPRRWCAATASSRGDLGRGVRGDRPPPLPASSSSTAATRWPSTSATRTRTTSPALTFGPVLLRALGTQQRLHARPRSTRCRSRCPPG